ncbi:MAG: AAA family ATPase [Kiloniellales bacterium]|nr:AAA family ATPase [Kiloniellales bacterium]
MPLYGLADLAAHPDKPVLLVEGEKTAEVAREILDDLTVTTWPHGAKAVDKIDWAPLKDRDVTAWPDADKDGRKGMEAAAAALARARASRIRIVQLPVDLPEGWDLAEDPPESWGQSAITDLIRDAVPSATVVDLHKGERPLEATPIGAFDFTKIPPRRWILGRRLQGDTVTLLIAPPGAGKTTFTIQEAIAVATGRDDLAQATVHQSGPVWIYNTEESEDELKRRVAAVCIAHAVPIADLAGRLFLNSGLKRQLIVAEETANGLVAKPDVAGLIEQISRHKIIGLFVDPLIRAHSCPENDNKAFDFVVQQFTRVSTATGCACEVVHHTRKPSGADATGHAGNPDTARGAGALIGGVRQAFTFMPMTAEEAKKLDIAEAERWRFVRLDNAKANQTARGGGALWFRHESVELGNATEDRPGDQVGVLKPTDIADAAERAKALAEEERKELARHVLELLRAEPDLTLSAVARRLLDSQLSDLPERTLRRRLTDSIPAAPGGITIETSEGPITLWHYKDGNTKTSPVRFRFRRGR